MMNREDVESLKQAWLFDPSWDIEDTLEFQDYHDELLAFRLQIEAKAAQEHRLAINQLALELDCSNAVAERIARLESQVVQLASKLLDERDNLQTRIDALEEQVGHVNRRVTNLNEDRI
jgi:hypothetical protein